ncbi:LssY C-terminal domain-containing protein [Paeniglutamicibacter sp. R2-26]|uniref:LssY C-terminal domain-containing protein n=1 Tax=Paeniglutamicibacter sp. R2-26 TaxID=3144417 RepID=UPI003EE65196
MGGKATGKSTDGTLDHVFFVLGGTATIWLAYLLVGESFTLGWGQLWFPLVFWAFVAYLLLPRLHRILTQIYVPGYFIGRARTSDGLLGDPVNLALLGTESQVHAAMRGAGWTMAEPVAFASGLRIAKATILRRSYPQAPVSPLYLFGRQQDFAYQQEVDSSPGKRHHVRFWQCPEGWLLPGGRRVDWLAAGTYDRSVGFSLFTLQVTHKIEANTDVERDHIVSSVASAEPAAAVTVIEDFSTGYHSRNGGGDSISTDGDLPVIDLRNLRTAAGAPPTAPLRGTGMPAPTVVGAALVVARAAVALLLVPVLLAISTAPAAPTVDGAVAGPEATRTALFVVAGVVLAFGLGELLLAWGILAGSSRARVAAMWLSTASIIIQAADVATGVSRITLTTGLAALACDVLILLALSSSRAGTYARGSRRGRARPPRAG